jgi:hypothetical protein
MYEYVLELKIFDLYMLWQLQIRNKCYALESMDYSKRCEVLFVKELESQTNQVEY